jgi:hypothetical protein
MSPAQRALSVLRISRVAAGGEEMAFNLAQKLVRSHLVTGSPAPGQEIALAVDQTLLQDVLGTLVMLELEAMGIDRVKVGLAAQYVSTITWFRTITSTRTSICFCAVPVGVSVSGTAGRATGSVIRSICSGSASPA